jgi:hypothetical protein
MKLKSGDIVASTATITFSTKPPNRKENQTLKNVSRIVQSFSHQSKLPIGTLAKCKLAFGFLSCSR